MGMSNYIPSSALTKAGVCTSTTRPASPYVGQAIYETDTLRFRFWNGSAWSPIVDAPTGTVNSFAGATAPTGWLLCGGQAISRTTYSDLFAVVGTTYGVGDGSTTFNIPDLRGRAIAGLDNMGGVDAGRLDWANTLGTSGGTQTNTHNHFQSVGYDGTIYAKFYTVPPRSKVETVSRGSIAGTTSTAPGRFDSTDNETIDIMQPTLLLNYIIRI